MKYNGYQLTADALSAPAIAAIMARRTSNHHLRLFFSIVQTAKLVVNSQECARQCQKLRHRKQDICSNIVVGAYRHAGECQGHGYGERCCRNGLFNFACHG